MKKIFGFIFLAVFIGMLFTSCDYVPSARDVAETAQAQSAQRAVVAVPIPEVSYFQEKRTIAKWAERWDKPSLPCYVYLVSYGTFLGYYVTDGKPASTRSYLMPEEKYYSNGATLSTADIDGTYGENNPGIRFFTAQGAAVEWGGQGACYIYSDVPLPLNVPRLNVSK